ncbi:16S rRNA (guanine(527)-N(7))-methyltransferase RsmG [Sphingomonas sp.]|uniref:16S rRNA (guanine(527)-N(7))-methyltransferase RsmG n=1 Tax=Sphingomonas sp. TaxID=28214 RepID=UPI001B0FE2A3|nr:16S rRNA (guanine(527)-N(7))-methyltransferase RsmG [Sphingomonas sp.]MBO9714732.1 16S rRNA (guanine(527)-N(7))-methyltransferase RsmG [Sphingomonas sp.]
MTEEEARAWVRERFGVSRETLLARFAELLAAENERQNLVAASTLETIWNRHLVDSAQLVPLADGAAEGPWLDIGSGPGLPGLVVAVLTERQLVLSEPRARRVEFLRHAAEMLGIADRVTVEPRKIEAVRLPRKAAVISARAVAELSQLLAAAHPCANSSTRWLLPKGSRAHSEVEAARRAWQGVFHVEPSITQPDSGIVVAQEVRSR